MSTLTSNTGYISGIPRFHALLSNCLQIQGVINLLRFYNLLDRFREFRKVLYFWLRFYCKLYKSGPAKWKDSKGKVQEGCKCRASELSHGISLCYFPATCSPARKLHWASASRVFIGISLCRHDWIIGCEWTQSPVAVLCLPGWSFWWVVQMLNHLIS